MTHPSQLSPEILTYWNGIVIQSGKDIRTHTVGLVSLFFLGARNLETYVYG
ncbi:MAG: hypothetical protein JWM43_892 [Acidobacteriaceae bacterium]|jgi:hypothetical protein|nr:hypothetical protein [Acidobacteriaceae bacterium]